MVRRRRQATGPETRAASVQKALGRWHEALEHLRGSLLEFRRIGHPVYESRMLMNMGEALVALGEIEEARSCLRQILALADTAHPGALETAQQLLDSLKDPR
ncbi:tetratricopeptide repeat protein [Streptacidiphilus carbonis]|jgi:tetratricopeptide (TPR) repeat protein|uniref:tetratricopeptide repeat protein n=1 Tax=Streptacidiphilus carbonis TaxID=105422 RepID=UPI0005A82075|nr:tetratricopeptide repeat protein [Streptacidiphilus carbonis]